MHQSAHTLAFLESDGVRTKWLIQLKAKAALRTREPTHLRHAGPSKISKIFDIGRHEGVVPDDRVYPRETPYRGKTTGVSRCWKFRGRRGKCRRADQEMNAWISQNRT